MYFRKQPHVSNFAFLKRFVPEQPARIGREAFDLSVEAFKDDIFRIRVRHPKWKKNYSQAGLTPPPKARRATSDSATLDIDPGFGLTLRAGDGTPLLTSPTGMTFGVSGRQSMFLFHHETDYRFYGMGEKMRGLELSGVQTKFWNTDIFADFHFNEIERDRPDPMYVSIPYLIIKQGNRYVGLLMDNPHATFISTCASAAIGGGQMKLSHLREQFITFGAEHGQPELYLLVGPSLPELTRKLQRLVGVTPLPPAWAIGYQQCRWGYRSADDLERLDARFREYGIPCDGLWLDIDYMDRFKVFSFNKEHFPKLKQTLDTLRRKGRTVVPILDPGVKCEPGYPVYESGLKEKAFCVNPQGGTFVGLVWPGETAFPDYSTGRGRRWWARHVEAFAKQGIRGVWIDMNDPSTGPVDCLDMLFNQGKDSHYTFHNQYGLGMARATRDGLAAAHPNQRPFLISRSGFTGIGKYSALWTGDSVSNYHYLRQCIAVSLNLALSGVPFNGPDIGGFARSTTAALLRDWMKACFLFPFCRNHTEHSSCDQEPWAFDDTTREILKVYIQWRYKLRPYLYNLFAQQELTGEAILRPLFYEFADTDALPLDRIDDQFLVGPAIMQAPVLTEHERHRDVVLPGASPWYSVWHGHWIEGERIIRVEPGEAQTPLFFRRNQIVAMTPGDLPTDNRFDSRKVELHVFLHPDEAATASYEHVADDGCTLDYQKGKRSVLQLTAASDGKGGIDLRGVQVSKGYGRIQASIVLHDAFAHITVNGKQAEPAACEWAWPGQPAQRLVCIACA